MQSPFEPLVLDGALRRALPEIQVFPINEKETRRKKAQSGKPAGFFSYTNPFLSSGEET